ncbi:MAG: PrgI family protein [Anaerovoracaceae bacterium]
MIEIKIPKEVTKYEAKLVGPFTARQCVTLLIFVPIIAFCYINLSKVVNSTVALYICTPIGGIGALIGWIKPYGLPLEKYLKSMFINSFIAPSVRLYKTENYYDLLKKSAEEMTPEQEYVIDALLAEVPEAEIKETLAGYRKTQKSQKQKKKKYQKSKKAVF